MTSHVDDYFALLGMDADDDLVTVLNSRGSIVKAGRVKIQDVINAASKSVAAFPVTTVSNPGRILNGVSERSYQEALMKTMASINNRSQA